MRAAGMTASKRVSHRNPWRLKMLGTSADANPRAKRAAHSAVRCRLIVRKISDVGGGPQKLDSVLSSDSDHSWRI